MASQNYPHGSRWEKRLLAMHGASETDEFIDAVFKLLATTVKCDFQLVNMRNVEGVPMIARDSRGHYFGPGYMERFFKLNPSVRHVLLRPGLKILHTRDHLPREEQLRKLPFYTEFMKPENWRHSVAMFFWAGFPPLPRNVFCVFRSESEPDFSDEEVDRLRQLHPHIATAIKRLRKQFRERSTRDGFAAFLERLPVAGILLDWDLRIIHENPAARKLNAIWNNPDKSRSNKKTVIPEQILHICQQLMQEWRDEIRQNSKPKLLTRRTCRHPDRSTLNAEISLVFQQESALAYPCFLIQYQDIASQTITNSDEKLNFLTLLTEGEREAVLLAVDGLDNQQIADRLGRSVQAIKLRLHQAFKKLNVQNRVQLANLLRH